MKPINRGKGTTKSERVLARLADRTFLDLWSYPNTFNDRDMHKGQGKELCDLLVVCGNDVLIFSDKAIDWPKTDDFGLAWSRWYKRAIDHSVKQIQGAERWLRRYPDRVFIDPECASKLPVDLPPASEMRVHGIAVATGARKAAEAFFGSGEGDMMVSGTVRGQAHLDTTSEDFLPFTVGDVAPSGSFVHVFDDAALAVVMREMDTVTDFADYLMARERAFRGGRLGLAASESELVAAYLLTINGEGNHDIPSGVSVGGGPFDVMHFPGGGYRDLKNHPQYRAKQQADRDGKAWDQLIRLFTQHVLAGTSEAFAGYVPDASLAERALRAMARENRTSRRALGIAFKSALMTAEQLGQDRFARVIMPFDGCADPECGYVFLVLAFRAPWLTEQGYAYYREGRAAYLKAYCQVVLHRQRQLKRMVGIAVDASHRITGRRGGSEDLLLIEIPEWTPELEAETDRIQLGGEILMSERIRASGISTREFPDLGNPSGSPLNRKGRREAAARRRRDKA